MTDIQTLRSRYVAMNGVRPVPEGMLAAIESNLGLRLPEEFHQITKFYNGGGFDVFPLYSLAGNAPKLNPIHETLRLRAAIGLPSNWIVLAEPPESLLLLNADSGKVIWIDAIDARRVAKGDFTRPPHTWDSFSDFFAFLLDKEETERD